LSEVNSLAKGIDELFQTILKELPSDLRAQAQTDFYYLLGANIKSYEALIDVAQKAGFDPKARGIACWVLGRSRDKKTVAALLAAFEDNDIDLQWEAAKSLGFLGSKRAVKPLIIALLEASSAEKRSSAAYALGLLQDKRAVNPLLRVLNTKREEARVRGYAAEALARFKESKVADSLIKALKDSNPEVRFWATYALGQIGDRKALPALKHLAQNDNADVPNWWKVSEEASEAINNINSRQ
jgi:HEAT repeat protein